ncbi:MAG: methionine biosynthesis protein MetW [Bacteroidota bacterium]
MSEIDNPKINDNRNYNYSSFEFNERAEYKLISEMVENNSKIIDLGCGNGALIAKLIKENNVSAKGIELSPSGITICKEKGLNVFEWRIDEKLPFADNEFDYAICNVTIQMVMYPEVLLSEMKRVAKYQIVSFPNFGFYKNRIDLLFNGRMPKPTLFSYNWYNTGHIHQLSLKDFEELVNNIGGLKIKHIEMLKPKNNLKWFFIKLFPNLFQVLFVCLLEKK